LAVIIKGRYKKCCQIINRGRKINHLNLPLWLENNKFFRFVFLLRKLYLTKTKATHFSQFAEDISIKRLFRKGDTGFFVDVGCFHPKKYSNTWMLYKAGWRGINVDIDAIKITGFDLVRPLDTNIACAVSNKEGEIVYYTSGFYSLTATLDADFAEKHKRAFIKKKTTCKPLTKIIDETKYKDRQIDFLSVDAEAHDLEVLKSLDFERYQPRLIAVETHSPVFADIEKSPLYKYLMSMEYSLVGWCGLTLLVASPQMQQELKEKR